MPLPSRRTLSLCALVATIALLFGVPFAAQTPDVPVADVSPENASKDYAAIPAGALSPRNANYTIEATFDPETRTLQGHQVLRWRNIQSTPTDKLYFHLYWNAWRNDQSTWLRESRLGGRRRAPRRVRDEDWGYLVVDRARLATHELGGLDPSIASEQDMAMDRRVLDDPEPDLATRFAAPDDGNPFDRTVMVVDLPAAVPPGGEVEVEMDWHAKVPRTFARTGARGDHVFIAHWFPKLGVYEPEGWNCHQFHAITEFYSDYGTYDVRLTLPDRYVVGATGRETETISNNEDGTETHRFQQDDVHAFTWTASPHYRVATRRFEEDGLPPVDMRLLYQEEHKRQVDRYLDATSAALKYYGTWYGAYPYGHVTVIDPAFGLGAGGMEYPTIFTGESRISRWLGGGSPEGVTVHEAGHQFWYGIVGNNEFEHAWIDEGLNTFSTARTMEAAYGESFHWETYFDPPGLGTGGFFAVPFRDVRYSRAVSGSRWSRYIGSRAYESDPQSTHTYRYYPGTASNVTYSKTAVWLYMLEKHLGWETLRQILSTFFERYKFHHPRPEDFFAVVDEVSGQDMAWFFDQVHRSSVTFDYAVQSVASRPAAPKGYIEGEDLELVVAGKDQENGEDDTKLFRSVVVVRRLAEGVFPVEVLLVFDDGTEVRRDWDGQERWKTFVEERPAKLAWAAVDPERVLLLDLNYSNNSRLMEAQAKLPARKWASKWMVWLQDLLNTYTFFI